MSTSIANPDSLWVGKRFGSVVVTAINGRDKFYVCDCGNTLGWTVERAIRPVEAIA